MEYILKSMKTAKATISGKTDRKTVGVKQKKGNRNFLISCLTVGIIFLIWIIASAAGVLDEAKVVPSIGSVWAALFEMSTEGYKGNTLLQHLGGSFYRLFTAFLLAVVTAIPMGLLSGMNSKVRAAMEPVIEFVRPLPPLAYYTVIVMWLGIGDGSKIMLLYLACFPAIYVACVASVVKIPEAYVNVAATLGANDSQMFRKVILPYTTPDIFTGVRTAFGHGYTTLVAAEMVAASSGIGWVVLDASNWLRSDIIFAGIIVMGITGIVFDYILRSAEKKLVPWKGKI